MLSINIVLYSTILRFLDDRMIEIRRSNQRGHFNFGWLDTYHTFSFGEYHDPKFMGFGNLRVLNQDKVQPGAGFPQHHHANMEIISYVVSGALEHKDSLGTGSIIKAGDVQYMSAGNGVTHSEFNPSDKEVVKFLQIWLIPNQIDLQPKYQQISVPRADKINRWRCVASIDGMSGSMQIAAAANIYASILQPLNMISKIINSKRAWLQVISGIIMLDTEVLDAGDGAGLIDVEQLDLISSEEAEIILIEC